MGSQVKVRVKGLAELEARMSKAPQLVAKELSTAIKKSVVQMQSDSIKEAPVRTGYLRQQIGIRIDSAFSGRVEAKAKYSAPVHDGSRPHIIRSHGNYPLRNAKTGQAFGRLVHHPGNKANPFFVRGVANAKTKVEGFFNAAIEAVVKAIA